MEALDKVRSVTDRLVGGGREQVDRVRAERRRSVLIKQLGEACYDKHMGTDSKDAIDAIVLELDSMAVDSADDVTDVVDVTDGVTEIESTERV